MTDPVYATPPAPEVATPDAVVPIAASPAAAPDDPLRKLIDGATISDQGIFAGLAVLPADTLIDEPALCRMLGLSSRTIGRMVARFDLPPPLMLGRRLWRVGAVRDHINAAIAHQAIEAARDAERKRELERRALPPAPRRGRRALTTFPSSSTL